MRPNRITSSAAILLGIALLSMTAAESTPRPRIQVHGHRGARARFPENTLPAFEYAIAQGVDVLELDMAVTRDNVLVVSHDPILEPPICTGPSPQALIHSLTLAEVKQWDCGAVQNPRFDTQQTVPGARVPALEEVFALAPKGSFQFNIETKIFAGHPDYSPAPREFTQLVLTQIRKHHLEKRVILQSFDFRTLRVMRELAPEIRLAALVETDTRDFTTIAREAGAGIISPYWELVTPEKTQAAHSAGLEVIPWTANKPEEWKRLANAGVDAIITDDPAALIAWLKQRKLR